MYNFKSIGKNVTISPKASIYGAEFIEIGDNVRIDDFCIISAKEKGIKIGSHIHIACYVSLIGDERIELEDFVQIAARSSILSATDDFWGGYAVGPCLPVEFRNVMSAPVIMRRHAVLGTNTVLLPGVTVGENAATGAFTLVNKDLAAGGLYVGVPAEFKRVRLPKILSDQDYIDQMTWYK